MHLELANVLRRDRQWERAASEYEAVLKVAPDNTEALRGIGTVRRWQGNIDKAKSAYEKARIVEPDNSDGLLGLAATYALDHDFLKAEELYQQAENTWPNDSSVHQEAYNFRRQGNPQLYLFWESGLSFETRQGGVAVPFAGREELGLDYQNAISFAPELDHAEIYTRKDKRLSITHYFGLNHLLELSARASKYQFNVPDSALEYSSIDTYNEYRIRYTFPFTPNNVFTVRYSARPTTLKLSQDNFTAHKVEGELDTRWTPTLSTLLGGGWLRDLDSNATVYTQRTNRSLVKLGFQWNATTRLSLGAKHITNPDLDNTMSATNIGEGSYSLSDSWSALGRLRMDDYKKGANQTSEYLAARFVPNSHWWSEFGVKHEKRGDVSGNYGLLSINYRF